MRHALLFTLILLLPACRSGHQDDLALYPASDASFQSDSTARAAALALLREANVKAMHKAFSRMDDFGFTRHTRTTQWNGEGQIVAMRERTVQFSGPATSPRVRAVDSVGTFDFGFLNPLAGREATLAPSPDLASYAIPEDPAYLDPRHREAFDFRRLPDTTISGTTVHVIDVLARPGEGDRESIRRARAYLSPNDELVGIDLWQQERTFLFAEDSRFLIKLRPAPYGGWLPDTLVVRTRLATPFRKARLLETSAGFDDYRLLHPASRP